MDTRAWLLQRNTRTLTTDPNDRIKFYKTATIAQVSEILPNMPVLTKYELATLLARLLAVTQERNTFVKALIDRTAPRIETLTQEETDTISRPTAPTRHLTALRGRIDGKEVTKP